MATVNKRGAAVTALLAALTNISVANGYLTDVASVSEIYEPSESLPDTGLPAVLYLDDGIETDIRVLTNQRVLVTFQADLLCYVTSPRDTNAFDADVKRAVSLDSALGGVVQSAMPLPQQERSNDATKTRGRFVRSFEIRYAANLAEGS